MLIRREIEFVGKNLLSPISPLNGYSKSFGNNILEEVVDYEIFSLATSGEKESLIEQNMKKLVENVISELSGEAKEKFDELYKLSS